MDILLVEDDQDDQELFIAALGGISDASLFAIANNGREAIDKLHRSPSLPAVIVMDINMPVMNGIECLLEMSKDPITDGIPVVMLSSDVGQRERTQQLGAVGFIEKPRTSLALRDALEQVLARIYNLRGCAHNDTKPRHRARSRLTATAKVVESH